MSQRRKKRRPTSVNILGRVYTIEYTDKPSDVDVFGRKSLWGSVDYWTRSIRILDNGRELSDIWETVIHEVIHGIAEELEIRSLKQDEVEDDIVRLSVALTDTLIRNGWLPIE